MMATYPALVQLLRILGRGDALAALGLQHEPDPADLSDEQRERLAALVDAQIDNVATELVDEAAASDDVADRASALAFVRERLAEFGDLLGPGQADLLLDAAARLVAAWD
jgi:hypothetical protein